jgi:hypothetical protein
MPHTEHKCACGKEFTKFRYYKEHILKHKCHTPTTITPLTPPTQQPQMQPALPQNQETTSQITNIDSGNILNPELETSANQISQLHDELIAYRSSAANINPKIQCALCSKLYSKHNINAHKSRCKYKYKDCYQYKLLVRAGITDIPESYIGVVELFTNLNEATPQIFMNLPPTITQVDDITSELPRNGRPRKVLLPSPETDNIRNLRPNIINHNTTNNNITNNNTNNTTNNNNSNNITNNTQQNINIFLNPVCQESTAHITPERQMYIILQRLHAFKAFIDSVYEVPANHNICISDRSGKKVKYLDAEHGINNDSAQNIIGNIAMAHLGQIDNFIETHKNNIPGHRQNDLKFLEALLLNENNNASVIKQLNDKVAMLSTSSKILLDKYQKEQALEHINSLPEPDE